MTRRIIIIIVGGLGILGLMFLLWFWFFKGQDAGDTGTGTFGAGQDTERGGVDTSGNSSNTQVPTGLGIGSNIETSIQGEPIGGPRFSSAGFSAEDQTYPGSYRYVPGVDWFDGSYTAPTPSDGATPSGGGSGSLFTPTPINQINSVSLDGTPYIRFDRNVNEYDLNAAFGIGGLALGCAAKFAVQKAASVVTGSAVVGFLAGLFGGGGTTYDPTNDANQQASNVIECIVRGLAQAAIQAITAQTIGWINSGFDGKPAYVQDFNKFFTDVSDQAAGQFIQGTALSFLCSPFQLQVRVAIAVSYAQRNVASAQACTLSQVVGNIDRFIEGDFSQGGWPGLISFTTEPSNNPFGAYMTAQARLNNQILLDTSNAKLEISPGGFLSRKDCVTDHDTGEQICQITTPGSTIEASLESVLKTNLDSLKLADSIDGILSALTNQLVTKTLYDGLANLQGSAEEFGGTALTPAERAAAQAANGLLSELRAAVRYAEQYGTVHQGSIKDIQPVQQALSDAKNCWGAVASSTLVGPAQQIEAQAKYDDANSRINALEMQVKKHNNEIGKAVNAIARVQELQTDALSAKSVNDIEKVSTRLHNQITAGRQYAKEDVASAQQDRAMLQQQMDTEEAAASASLTQCNAVL